MCYPVEAVTKFETKSTEAEGWQEKTGTDYLIRSGCIVSLKSEISNRQSSVGRITYTGGYVLPGTEPGPDQTPLPDDLEQAAVEHVAYWFQSREHLA